MPIAIRHQTSEKRFVRCKQKKQPKRNNKMKPTLSKGIITKRVKTGEYLIKDIFTENELVIKMSGKECMNYKYEIGEEVYYAKSELRPELGKLMTPTGFKYNEPIYSLKKELDRRYIEFLSNKECK